QQRPAKHPHGVSDAPTAAGHLEQPAEQVDGLLRTGGYARAVHPGRVRARDSRRTAETVVSRATPGRPVVRATPGRVVVRATPGRAVVRATPGWGALGGYREILEGASAPESATAFRRIRTATVTETRLTLSDWRAWP